MREILPNNAKASPMFLLPSTTLCTKSSISCLSKFLIVSAKLSKVTFTVEPNLSKIGKKDKMSKIRSEEFLFPAKLTDIEKMVLWFIFNQDY